MPYVHVWYGRLFLRGETDGELMSLVTAKT